MVLIDELVERSGDLKREALAFATGPARKHEFRKQLTARFGDPAIIDQKGLENSPLVSGGINDARPKRFELPTF